ncbi:unannotated protein [freshwater metagenome]|uniref:Unannotated protein n=1 Tax=freshwater metagenome TaxID=449393 RepID=A0A6J7DZ05_9ZZZZ|nr:phosphoribosyltransferase [Actinomycetota bacterium]
MPGRTTSIFRDDPGPPAFRDRRQAGQRLAGLLAGLAGERPVVLALPRGGVPVAYEVAKALGAPLDVLVVRKIGAPGNPELAMGAIAEGNVRVFDTRTIASLLVSEPELEHAIIRAEAELQARLERYRSGEPGVPVAGRTVLVVDDGLATGSTAGAAVQALRDRGAQRIIVAVPVGALESAERLRGAADEVVCLAEPYFLDGVGAWYEEFGQVSDDTVTALLANLHQQPSPEALDATDWARSAVRIPLGPGPGLEADLSVPPHALGLVIFAHGTGSGRNSARNRHVAAQLNEQGLATLLLDLLTPEEELNRSNVFDVRLLAGRLLAATRWALEQEETAGLPIAYFGASTGAGAALIAAAQAGPTVKAVVSRGGRPDLAQDRLKEVRAPVLLIVGGEDSIVLELNRSAAEHLSCEYHLTVVPGATHLFEEPGTLDEVAEIAARWLLERLT